MQITWQDLLKDINDIPVVDVHSHLKFERLEADDLSSICLYHMLGYELKSSGYKEDSEAEPYSNMEAAAPYYKFIRNGSFHWCMMSVMNDLYGFEEETITEKNWKKAWDLVENKAKPGRITYLCAWKPDCGLLMMQKEQTLSWTNSAGKQALRLNHFHL